MHTTFEAHDICLIMVIMIYLKACYLSLFEHGLPASLSPESLRSCFSFRPYFTDKIHL